MEEEEEKEEEEEERERERGRKRERLKVIGVGRRGLALCLVFLVIWSRGLIVGYQGGSKEKKFGENII